MTGGPRSLCPAQGGRGGPGGSGEKTNPGRYRGESEVTRRGGLTLGSVLTDFQPTGKFLTRASEYFMKM